MIPWRHLDSAPVPGGEGELHLFARGEEFSIRVAAQELMNSRVYASEDALSEIGCARVAERRKARVLIGGLGMGYSLRSALKALGPDAHVVVAELVPAVVRWNREHFGHLADHPLRDRRVSVREEDVGAVIAERKAEYDAILLDVDNGPNGLTRIENDRLYGDAGLARAKAALRSGGVLGIWSAGADRAFAKRMRKAGFDVDEVAIKSRPNNRGARHTLWLGTRGDGPH